MRKHQKARAGVEEVETDDDTTSTRSKTKSDATDYSNDDYLYFTAPSPNHKMRVCIKCRQKFLSTGSGNRHCDKCRKELARLDKGLTYTVSLYQLAQTFLKGR